MRRPLPSSAIVRLATMVTLATAMLFQRPGHILPETKLDLAIDPARFTQRALHLWQADIAFGHVQNQAAGYLVPMAPVFTVLSAGLPAWVVQRLWMAAILALALWGTVRLTEQLGIGTPGSRLASGLAYALSPAMLPLLALTSGGQVPMALAPWALYFLVRGASGGYVPRSAAASALTIAAMGAVNAVSTLGALPLCGLYLLTRQRGPRRRQLALWWIACTTLATLWWIIPLIIQGRYGLDFLPLTETAATTTSTTSVAEVLRGSGHWLNVLMVEGRPWLPAGWAVATFPLVIAATGALTALGLAGLARPDHPERTFLISTVALCTSMIAAAYSGPAGGPLSAVLQDALDGPLSPFRNLHKLEPGIRLPVAVGLAHLVASLGRVRAGALSLRPMLATAAAALALVGALPVFTGKLAADGSFDRIPTHWHETASWLESNAGGGVALVVPATSFAEHRWGRPLDEPLQPLARSPWAARNLIPLGSPANTELLDAIDRPLSAGLPVPGLAELLRRAGVEHLVVRNDLDLARTDAPAPAVVRSSLRATPGLAKEAEFGPPVPAGVQTDQLVADLRLLSARYRSVEIWSVEGESPTTSAHSIEGGTSVAGHPGSVLHLAAADALGDGPAVLVGDPGPAPPHHVVTDDVRRRSRRFGDVRAPASHALAPEDRDPVTGREPIEATPAREGSMARVRLDGATRLRASSSGSFGSVQAAAQPFAAFDGVESSAWTPANRKDTSGAWLQIDLAEAIDAPAIEVQLLRDRPTRATASAVKITTDAGSRTTRLSGSDRPQRVPLPAGPAKRIRITVTGVRDRGEGPGGAGIAEVTIPGVRVRQVLDLPSSAGAARTAALHRELAAPFRAGERDEDTTLARTMVLEPGAYSVRGTAVPDDRSVERFLPASPVQTSASSRFEDLVSFDPRLAVDPDPFTAWVASPFDGAPSIHLSWPSSRAIDGLRLRTPAGPFARPTKLHLVSGDEVRSATLDAGGTATFPTLSTSQLTVIVVDADRPARRLLGLTPPAVAVSDLIISGIEDLRSAPADSQRALSVPCGEGPALLLDGRRIETSVTGTVGQLIAQQPLSLVGCGLVEAAGRVELSAAPGGGFSAVSLVVDRDRPARSAAERSVSTTASGAESRRHRIGPGSRALLSLAENANDGWRASMAGVELRSATVDGWRQSWVVPPGPGGEVSVTFPPGRTYRAGLMLGLLSLTCVLGVWLLARRPSESNPVGPAVPSRGLLITLAVLPMFVLVGPGALIAPLLLLLPGRRISAALLVTTSYMMATAIAALHAGSPAHGRGALSAAAQILSALALAVLLVSLMPDHTTPAEERAS